jgi:hypothetical protein
LVAVIGWEAVWAELLREVESIAVEQAKIHPMMMTMTLPEFAGMVSMK